MEAIRAMKAERQKAGLAARLRWAGGERTRPQENEAGHFRTRPVSLSVGR